MKKWINWHIAINLMWNFNRPMRHKIWDALNFTTIYLLSLSLSWSLLISIFCSVIFLFLFLFHWHKLQEKILIKINTRNITHDMVCANWKHKVIVFRCWTGPMKHCSRSFHCYFHRLTHFPFNGTMNVLPSLIQINILYLSPELTKKKKNIQK